MKIKDYSLHDRPRERLLSFGPEKLQNAELLALIIGSGTKTHNALMLAQQVLQIHEKEEATIAKLTQIQGIGPAKAAKILAALTLAQRQTKKEEKTKIITSAKIAAAIAKEHITTKQEHVILLCLNTKQECTHVKTVFIGTLAESILHPRDIFREATANNASSIILVHNHPSGNVQPSQEDISTTESLLLCAELLQIPFLDHIIIAKNKHFSFCEEGLLEELMHKHRRIR